MISHSDSLTRLKFKPLLLRYLAQRRGLRKELGDGTRHQDASKFGNVMIRGVPRP